MARSISGGLPPPFMRACAYYLRTDFRVTYKVVKLKKKFDTCMYYLSIYKSKHTELNDFERVITVIKFNCSRPCAPFSSTNYLGTRNRGGRTPKPRNFKAIDDDKRLFSGRFSTIGISGSYFNDVLTRLRKNTRYSRRI